MQILTQRLLPAIKSSLTAIYLLAASLNPGKADQYEDVLRVNYFGSWLEFSELSESARQLLQRTLPEWSSLRNDASEAALAAYPIEKCVVYEDYQTDCFVLRGLSDNDAYGDNMKFVTPIAALPGTYYDPGIGMVFGGNSELEEPANDEDEYTESDVGLLPAYVFSVYNEEEEMRVPEYFWPPLDVDLGLSKANATIGGEYALDLYFRLAEQLPQGECIMAEAFCSVILRGEFRESDVLVYCAIVKASEYVGLPFKCSLIAIQLQGEWYVQAVLGPAVCDGCGANAGATCYLKGKFELGHIASELSAIVGSSKIGLDLRELPSGQSSRRPIEILSLVGNSDVKDSQFFSGYFEKSFAIYNIYDYEYSGEHTTVVEGLYNLLISAEPSRDSVNYHDIPAGNYDSNLEWLQQTVQSIYIDGFTEKGYDIKCDVMPIY